MTDVQVGQLWGYNLDGEDDRDIKSIDLVLSIMERDGECGDLVSILEHDQVENDHAEHWLPVSEFTKSNSLYILLEDSD